MSSAADQDLPSKARLPMSEPYIYSHQFTQYHQLFSPGLNNKLVANFGMGLPRLGCRLSCSIIHLLAHFQPRIAVLPLSLAAGWGSAERRNWVFSLHCVDKKPGNAIRILSPFFLSLCLLPCQRTVAVGGSGGNVQIGRLACVGMGVSLLAGTLLSSRTSLVS